MGELGPDQPDTFRRLLFAAAASEIRSADGQATSTFDARGTLGLDRTVDVGVAPVTVEFVLDCDAQLARLGVSTERYCVVGQSLSHPPRMVVGRQASASS